MLFNERKFDDSEMLQTLKAFKSLLCDTVSSMNRKFSFIDTIYTHVSNWKSLPQGRYNFNSRQRVVSPILHGLRHFNPCLLRRGNLFQWKARVKKCLHRLITLLSLSANVFPDGGSKTFTTFFSQLLFYGELISRKDFRRVQKILISYHALDTI